MINTPTLSRSATPAASGYERVVSFLKEQLISGALKEGDMLLPERELAATLGVSRPMVREALRALAIIGVVEILHGVGTVVRRPNAQTLGEFFGIGLSSQGHVIEDVFQARIAIECQAIRLACRYATQADLDRLEECVEIIGHTAGETREGAKADFEFHRSMVVASRSQTLISMYGVISDLLLRSHVDRRQKIVDEAGIRQAIADSHYEIVTAIRGGDADAADQALRAHFAIGKAQRNA